MASESKGIGRRGFFGAAAASAAALTMGGARPAAAANQPMDERLKARYRETEHVQAFYRTNRYYQKKEG
ncbi:MAG: hypothetical protein ACK4KW_04295 [Gemmobacter sp.]